MVAGELVVRDGSIIAFLQQLGAALKSLLFASFGSFKFQLIDFCFSATCNSLLMHLVAWICCRYSLD